MLIGAQLFSLREQCKTPADIRETFRRCKDMGYQVIQASGIGKIDPYELRDISQEFDLPITVTHIAPARLEEELDQVIAEHKIYGCPVIGLGAMPKVYRDGTFATYETFLKKFKPIQEKIEAAGLRFAYHNHSFEFATLDNGVRMFDHMTEFCTFDIIADVCWIRVGGEDVPKMLRPLKGRLQNCHLKDIRTLEKGDPNVLGGRDFCPLGQGVVDIPEALATLKEVGCEFAHVEQDNATQKDDPFGEMLASADYLRKEGAL